MRKPPNLTAEDLKLRPFEPGDAPWVQQLAGDRAVAATTLSIPHPYEDGLAEEWIAGHESSYLAGRQANFAVVLKEKDLLIGAIGLEIEIEHKRAHLGYWIGKPYWNNGYCTQAGHALLKFGFAKLNLNRIYAAHFTKNPASGRVMQKIGMKHEGTLRQHVRRWSSFIDLELYAILKTEWEKTVIDEINKRMLPYSFM